MCAPTSHWQRPRVLDADVGVATLPRLVSGAELTQTPSGRSSWIKIQRPLGAGSLGWTERRRERRSFRDARADTQGSCLAPRLVGGVGPGRAGRLRGAVKRKPLGLWCLTAVGRQSLGGLRFGTL